MRIVVHGQQAFGKAVLEALLKRGEDVVAVYAAPEKPGQKADPLKEAALAAKLPVYQPASYRKPEVWEEFRALKPDLQVMAFVTLFVPEEFPQHPDQGLDPVSPLAAAGLSRRERDQLADHQGRDGNRAVDLLARQRPRYRRRAAARRRRRSAPTDTLGTVYFDRLFPMGVEAMLEAVDLVKAGKAPRIKQDDSQATYEGRCTADNARIDWGKPWRQIHNLIRGCNPAPGAWTTLDGKPLQDLRRQAAAGQGPERHRRQDGRDRRGLDRRLHRRLRRRPLQGAARENPRRPQSRRRRIRGEQQARRRHEAHMIDSCRPRESGDPVITERSVCTGCPLSRA